jgi:hypothetical protein
VLEVAHAAQKAKAEPGLEDAMLYHLAAVAAMRLGQEKEARRYWKRALELEPGLELARANLEDLQKPIAERHAPWPFDLPNWTVYLGIADLAAELKPALRPKGDAKLHRVLERFVEKHPGLSAIVPHLLDAGDPAGRELALQIALAVRTPEMLAALKEFALSQRGPDAMRLEAAQVAGEAGLLPPDLVRLWQQGEWREVRLLSYEIYDEPTRHESQQVEEWHEEAHDALYEGDAERAEDILRLPRRRSWKPKRLALRK